ncbi:MAG: hypothetical protein IPL28_15440 [Chloroflexi bacterium]|nr:hypothetical protein [Chloroflexota bacterium]
MPFSHLNLPPACVAELLARYGEAHRAYHNAAHVAAVLATAETVRGLASDFAAVEMAICFHDVIYDPRAKDNEAQSAAVARRWLAQMGWEEGRMAAVESLIMATQHHQPQTADAQIVVDTDLAILGRSQPPMMSTRKVSAVNTVGWRRKLTATAVPKCCNSSWHGRTSTTLPPCGRNTKRPREPIWSERLGNWEKREKREKRRDSPSSFVICPLLICSSAPPLLPPPLPCPPAPPPPRNHPPHHGV